MGGEVDYSEHDNFYNNEVLPGIIRQGYSKKFLITVLLTKIFRRLRRKVLRLTDIKNGKKYKLEVTKKQLWNYYLITIYLKSR